MDKLKQAGSHALGIFESAIAERLLIMRSKLETSVDQNEMFRLQGEIRSLLFINSSITEARK